MFCYNKPDMDLIPQVFVFVFGTLIGSFTNAVLWRLRTGESFIFGRSYCPHCRHELSAPDLVPVFSYVLLAGRCRYCRKGIHPHYIAVELAMGLLFLLFARHDLAGGFTDSSGIARLVLHWYFCVVLTIIFVYDLRYMLILRSVTMPATVIAFAANLALGDSAVGLAAACVVGAGFFYAQHALSRGRWVGGGDINLGLLMGAMLGWPHLLLALMLAYVSGASVGIVMLARRSKTWKSQIPFGTFLSLATVVTLLWGDRILAWYFGLL